MIALRTIYVASQRVIAMWMAVAATAEVVASTTLVSVSKDNVVSAT
jgi:hypothetical protein